MLHDDTVFEFITKSENLAVALEVANYVERLKDTLHPLFWETFNSKIMGRVVDSGLSNSWEYETKLSAKAYKSGWTYNEFLPIRERNSDTPFLFMRFGQGSSETNYRLRGGVRWAEAPTNFMHPALATLTSTLISLGLEEIHEDINIIKWGFYDQEIYSPDFLMNMYNQPDEWVENIVSDIWQNFLHIFDLMETINKAVASS